MNEIRRKPTTGRQSPSLFDKSHGIFYINMPSHIDEAGHTKAFDYPVAVHWRESRNVQFHGWDLNRQHIGTESNALPEMTGWELDQGGRARGEKSGGGGAGGAP